MQTFKNHVSFPFSQTGSLHHPLYCKHHRAGLFWSVHSSCSLLFPPSHIFSFAAVWILHGLQEISALAPGASPPPPAHMMFCVPSAFSHNFVPSSSPCGILPLLRYVFPEESAAWPCFARTVGESLDGLCSPWSLLTEATSAAPPLWH